MLRVAYPTKNKQTQSFSPYHPGYDFSGNPKKEVRCPLVDGLVVQAKNSEIRNWLANKPDDPWYKKGVVRKLKTEDLGNYIKIRGRDLDGNECYILAGHFEPGSVVKRGERVHLGQVIAQIGHTGNSTGPHLHLEGRNLQNESGALEFSEVEDKPIESNHYRWLEDLAHEKGSFIRDVLNRKPEKYEDWVRESLHRSSLEVACEEVLRNKQAELDTTKEAYQLLDLSLKKCTEEREGGEDMAEKTNNKVWWQSKTMWTAVVQGVAGVAAVFLAEQPELQTVGWIAISKSVIDTYLRTTTKQPLERKLI